MRKILAIAAFEARQRLRRISTWVYCLIFFAMAVFFMLAAGGAISGAHVDFGTGGKVFVNSPYSIHVLETLIGLFGVVMVASIAGQATFQDIDHGTTSLFFTAPLSERQYLAGRLLGALAICALCYFFIALGAAVGTHLSVLDPARVGPGPGAGAYLWPYLTVLAPNLFFCVALFFSLSTVTRRMMPVYTGSVVLMIGYLIALNLSDDVENKKLISMLDPFGLIAVDRVTEYWTVVERNARTVPLTGILLWNRLAWTAAGLAMLAFTFGRFSFTASGGSRQKPAPVADEALAPVRAPVPLTGSEAPLDYSARASWLLLWKLTRLQWRETVKSVVFVVLVLAGVLFMGSVAPSVGRIFGTRTLPVTHEVLELVGGSFTAFVFAIITFYSGELVWRERDARLAQIHDALPVPGWLPFASKWLALSGVGVLLLALTLVTGVVLQTLKGYHHYELSLYLRWLFALRLADVVLLITLAFLVHVVVNNKYLGHFVMVLYFVSNIALPLLGVEHKMIRYGSLPGWQYSDMNGFGAFVAPLVWFKIYWGCLAVALAALSNLLWVRGVETGWRHRLRLARQRLGRGSVAALSLGLLGFAGSGAFIFYNLNVLHPYRNSFDAEERQAQYEKKYKAAWSAVPGPRVIGSVVSADLFPSERRALLSGQLTLENKTSGPVDTVAVNLNDRAKVEKLALGRGEKEVVSDLAFHVFELGQPLAPNERATLDFALSYENHGFEGDKGDTHIVGNGTFIDSMEYLPVLGYQEGRELSDDTVRRKHGLAEKQRMRDLDDPSGLANNYVAKDADWITFKTTVSTDPDQVAIAPGYLQKEWVDNGRRYFTYEMDAPILNFYSFLSARYQVKKDAWNQVAIEIYYHPGHDHDVDRMIKGVKASLDYFTQQFGPYQHRQVRIIEFPRYQTFAQSFPNTIPYSESIGFIADVDDSKEDEIDYPYYVTAHEVAHQWWAHQVIGGDVQGSTMLSESFSEYSAFMVQKRAAGERAMRKFLRIDLDRYLQGRAGERKKELPLMRVEDQMYIHYAKGALVMYALQDALGEETVNRALKRFLEKTKYQGPPYTNARAFLEVLRAEAPGSAEPLIHDLFEEITLYELKATRATAVPLHGGRYRVTVVASAKKMHAGELGAETEAPLDQELTFGALDAKGKVLALHKERVKSGEVTVSFECDGLPAKAGIDPLNMWIDRLPDDNVTAVEVAPSSEPAR